MANDGPSLSTVPSRTPWNKGKLIGAKPPLDPTNGRGRTRDLAMFNLAIDSKLRGCDVMPLKVEDVAPNGYTIERATVRQRKTGRPVKFELTEQTRQAIEDYLRALDKRPGEFLFTSRRQGGRCMTTRHYARRFRMDRQHWARSEAVWDPFAETDQGDPDLPAHWQPAGRADPAWPQ